MALGIPIQILNGISEEQNYNSDFQGLGTVMERAVRQALTYDAPRQTEIANFLVDGGLRGGNSLLGTFDGFDGINSLKGFEDSVLEHLIKTRELVVKNPDAVKQIQNPIEMVKMYDYAIKNWNTPNRDKALEILAEKEMDLIESGHIKIAGLSGYDGLGGGWNRIRKGLKSVGNAVKKVAQNVDKFNRKVWDKTKEIAKKAWKGLKRWNPLSVAVKLGLAAAFRLNMFKMADQLAPAYLTEKQAIEHGMTADDHKKTLGVFKKVEDMWVNAMGGKETELRDVILAGDRKQFRHLTGFPSLGTDPGTATTVTAASSVIATVVAWLKKAGGTVLKVGKKVISVFKKKPELEELAKSGVDAAKNKFQEKAFDNSEDDAETMKAKAEQELEEMKARHRAADESGATTVYEPASADYYKQVAETKSAQPITFGAKLKAFLVKYKKPIIITSALLVAAVITGVVYATTKKSKAKAKALTNNQNAKPTEKKALQGVRKVVLT